MLHKVSCLFSFLTVAVTSCYPGNVHEIIVDNGASAYGFGGAFREHGGSGSSVGGHVGGHGGSGGLNSGGGLSGIAHGSAIQAKSAAQNQEAAGNQAAFVAKSSLSQAAAAVSLLRNMFLKFI